MPKYKRPRPLMEGQKVVIRFTAEDRRWLEEEATRTKTTISALVRLAVADKRSNGTVAIAY